MRKTKKLVACVVVFLAAFIVMPSLTPLNDNVQNVEAAKVKISAKKATMYVGDKKNLKIKGTSAKVKWSSSKKKVATVTKKGVVKAKKAGKATITAKVNKKKYTCKITVKTKTIKVSSVKLDKAKLEVFEGKTSKLTATVYPAKATNKTVKWSSSDTSIAYVDGSGNVRGMKAGTAIITATASGKKATCTVQVKGYGQISGNVTYYYNSYQGNKPDTGTTVLLIPVNGSAKTYNSTNFGWLYDSTDVLKKYNIYRSTVDGMGQYSISNVPEGDYIVFMRSSKTTSGAWFESEDAYIKEITNSVAPYVSSNSAKDLGEAVMFYKYFVGKTTIKANSTTTLSHDFGITYI